MKTVKDILISLGGVAAFAVFAFTMWALVAIIGISEGSNDLCTESFKSFVKFLLG